MDKQLELHRIISQHSLHWGVSDDFFIRLSYCLSATCESNFMKFPVFTYYKYHNIYGLILWPSKNNIGIILAHSGDGRDDVYTELSFTEYYTLYHDKSIVKFL